MNNHKTRTYDSMLGLLSGEENPTPLVRLNRVVPYTHTKVFAKLEWYNPFGSVKDRVASNLIVEAEHANQLGEVRKLVEPTSGNTGMGLAMMANLKGYSLTTPLSKAIPVEKRTALRLFGSDVIELSDDLCPAPGAPEGAMQRATDIAAQPGYLQLNQYKNANNPAAHIKTTGPEIWRQTEGRITHFVAGLGTCGTITGGGRFLKSKDPDIQVLGVYPEPGHDIPGVRSLKQLEHADFYHPEEYDGQTEVTNKEAYEMTLRLQREEGIIAGPSSGMALVGALRLIPDEPGLQVVVMFPDNAFKYTTSFRKHLPELFPPAEEDTTQIGGGLSAEELLLQELIANARHSPDSIDIADVQALQEEPKGVDIIDVRSPEEYAQGHMEGSINIPLQDLNRANADFPNGDRPVVAVCNAGNKSLSGLLVLKSLGIEAAKSMRGGLNQWVAEGNPLVSMAKNKAV